MEPSVALQRLDAADDIDIQPNLALTYAALAIEAGEFDVAKTVLTRLQSQGQDTPEIELMLANAARLSGNPKSEMDHLAAASQSHRLSHCASNWGWLTAPIDSLRKSEHFCFRCLG